MKLRPVSVTRVSFWASLVMLCGALAFLPCLVAASSPLLYVVDLDALPGAATAGAVFSLDPTVDGSTVQTTVSSSGHFIEPSAIAMDQYGNLAVTDRTALKLIGVNATTGAQTEVSSGGNFVDPSGVAFEADGSIVVVDGGAQAVIRVHPITGAQSIVSSGGFFSYPAAITRESGGSLVVADADNGNIVRVDAATGAQTRLSHGGNLVSPLGLAVDENQTLLVADSGTQSLLRINPAIADNGLGSNQVTVSSGGSFLTPTGVVVDADRSLLVADLDAGSIFRVDRTNGAQTLVNSGGAFSAPYGLTLPPRPFEPNGLTAALATGVRGIDLAWTDHAANNTGYAVQRRRPGYNWGTQTTLGDVTSWQDTLELKAGVTYEYRVRAFNTAGYSAGATAQATMPAPPSAPSGLTATANGSSRINLSWTDNSADEDGFRLERKSGGGSFTTVAKFGTNVTNCVSAGLAASTTYTYRIRAYRGVDLSAPSGEASATTGPPLPAPSGLQGTAVGSSRINLSWEDNSSDETGFKVERRGSGGSFTGIATVGAGVTNHVVAGLTANTAYTFRVRAARGVELSAPSNEAGATTATAVAAPTALTVTANGSRRLDLAWTDNAGDETSYKVERKSGAGIFTVIATLPAEAVSYVSTGLTGGVQYTYRVRAYRGSDFSAYSASAIGTANP